MLVLFVGIIALFLFIMLLVRSGKKSQRICEIMLAVLKEASPASIQSTDLRRRVEDRFGSSIGVGRLYACISQLEKEGRLTTTNGPATQERGWRRTLLLNWVPEEPRGDGERSGREAKEESR